LRAAIAQGRAVGRQTYRMAQAHGERCRLAVDALFEGYDLLLAPAAAGEAPEGLGFTGDPAFNRIWTLLHVPCVALPGGRGPHGLPLGVQLVGPRRRDEALLGWAAWAEAALAGQRVSSSSSTQST
jgi:amidase